MPSSFDPNWQTFGLLIAYSAAVILASVVGGMLPEWIRLTHTRMQLMISFVGGLMLGIAVFHMIPHALVAAAGEVDQMTLGVMLGLVATFFLIRIFHFHQHGPADFGIQADLERSLGEDGMDGDSSHPSTHLCSQHNHPTECSHLQPPNSDTQGAHVHKGTARWVAVLLGLGLHTLMDGVAMASGVVSESAHQHGFVIPGFGIFLAVLLHKPLDAVSITSLMHPVTTPGRRMLVNLSFALMCPLGALLFWAGASLDGTWAQQLAAWGLAFSAGVFLCISLSDLLPEMEFHSHSRIQLSVALLLGIAVAWSIGWLEGEHAHSHSASHSELHSHEHEEGEGSDEQAIGDSLRDVEDAHAGHEH